MVCMANTVTQAAGGGDGKPAEAPLPDLQCFIPAARLRALRLALAAMETPKGHGRTEALKSAAKEAGSSPSALYRIIAAYRDGGISALAERPNAGRFRKNGTSEPGGDGRGALYRELTSLLRAVRYALDRIERGIASATIAGGEGGSPGGVSAASE